MDGGFEQWASVRGASLLRTAYLLTGSQAVAEDLAQNTLEKVAVAWPRIEAYPDAYARQVMYRLELSRWRRRRFAELSRPIVEVTQVDPTDDLDLRLVMRQALRRITAAQRAVLVLRFYEDLSEADTAAVLGCAVGTVKSQTHKALTALRQAAPDLAEIVGRRLSSDV